MTSSLRRPALAAAFLALCAAGNATAAPTWLTIGEKAHALLMEVAPQTRTLASRSVPVTVPAEAGKARLVNRSETVHAVLIDDEVIAELSERVHTELHRCGGFAQHASMAEAMAVLHRLESTPEPTLLPSYVIDNQAQVNALLPQVQASNLMATIDSLAAFQNRRHTSTHGVDASNWLFNAWNQLNPNNIRGVKVSQISHSWGQKSVQFEFQGRGNASETIVIGAHLDSTGSGNAQTVRAPGADDDASGVAGLTEIIRVLMNNRFIPQRNIRVIAYAAEEAGLLGSRDIAIAALTRPDATVGVLQLDMTAYRGDATELWLYTDYTNAAQNQFLANLITAYLPGVTVGYSACGYGCSDHASWHNRGFVASFPHEASNDNYNKLIHTVNDTVATFAATNPVGDPGAHALKFTKLALAWVAELALDGTPAAQVTPAAGNAPTRAR